MKKNKAVLLENPEHKLNENQIFISQKKNQAKKNLLIIKKKKQWWCKIIRKEIKNQLIRDNEKIIKFKKVRIM